MAFFMKHRILLNLIVSAQSNTALLLAKLSRDSGATMEFCRFYTFDDMTAATVVFSGEWAMPPKMQKCLEVLQAQEPVQAVMRSITQVEAEPGQVALMVQVIAPHTKEVGADVVEFFDSRGIKVIDMYVERFVAPHSTVPMMSLGLTIVVKDADFSLSFLREEFLEYCDELNVDGVLELEKA